MRIISFSDAATQPFWALRVQALAPWTTNLKHSHSQNQVLSAAQRIGNTFEQPFASDRTSASGHSTFAMPDEAPVPTCWTASKASGRGSLRIVRESDSAISPDCAGRMVISGRMADVCAELDRMALQAAATQ